MHTERLTVVCLLITWWVSQLVSSSHGFVLPRARSPSAQVSLRVNRPRPLKQKQSRDDDDTYTPYYDGEYHLEDEARNSSPFSSRSNKRVRPNFEAVFQGMPGLADILYGGRRDNNVKTPSASQNVKDTVDRSDTQEMDDIDEGQQEQLSLEDLEEIERNFQRFKAEMRDSLQQMRIKDPNSVPDNAEFILDQVVEEQRAYDIKERSEKRAVQAFDDYYKEQMKRNVVHEQKQERVDTDPVVQEIVEEMNLIQKAERDLEEKYQAFKSYEKKSRDKLKKGSEFEPSDSDPVDFDQLQLQLMRDLLIKRQEAAMKKGAIDDEDLYTTDNLEDGIDELSNKIEEKQRLGDDALGGSKWTLKDWQMYRAIVSKQSEKKRAQDVDDIDLLDDDETDDEDDWVSLEDSKMNEEQDDDFSISDKKIISKQLDAWKEYQIKEENMRKKMGLSVNVRTPFPWSDKLYKGEDNNLDTDSYKKTTDRKTFSVDEVEKASLFLDQTAVEIMTDLMMKTQDKERREKLRLEIEELKEEIRRRNNTSALILDNAADYDQKTLTEPLQISDILSRVPQSNTVLSKEQSKADPRVEDKALRAVEVSTVSPPSPTFAPSRSTDLEDKDDVIPSLGTLNEQKFRSLVARSGVRTVQEQESLREKWEEFQRAEQRMRDRTGLSGNDITSSSSVNYQDKLKYNVSDVLLKGGDVNADAILSTIGQRPRRKGKTTTDSSSQSTGENDFVKSESQLDSYQSFLDNEERIKAERLRKGNNTYQIVDGGSSFSKDDGESSTEQSDKSGDDIRDQIYRSYGATIHRDPSKNLKDKSAFEEFLKREEEARKSFENASKSTPVRDDINIDTYADDVLSTLKPRPKPKSSKNNEPQNLDDILPRKPRNVEDDYGMKRSSAVQDTIKKPSVSRSSSILSEQMPDWLRREIEEKRGEEFDLLGKGKSTADDEYGRFDDGYDEDEYIERERQAADFERKFSNAPKDVSISDLFGRDYFGPDDVDDYNDGRSSRDYFSSFESRKATLMEYRMLSVEDLNSLMEYKSSAIETGVSPYLSRVNRPFSSFGAIFRLEGCLLDITGLHFAAWKKTAEEHELQVPDVDDVRFAAVHSPEFSIQRIFYWSNDIVFVRTIAKTFRLHFSSSYDTWINSLGVNTADGDPMKVEISPTGTSRYMNAQSSSDDPAQPTRSSVKLSELDLLKLQLNVWSIVADKYGFKKPTFEDIQFTVGFTPEESVKGVFMWTRESSAVSDITSFYKNALKDQTEELLRRNNIQPIKVLDGIKNAKRVDSPVDAARTSQNQNLEPQKIITEEDVIALHLRAWTHAAEQYGYRKLSIDEVQVAKFVGPEKAIQSIFKWPVSPSSLQDVVSTFRTHLKTLSLDLASKVNAIVSTNSDEGSVKTKVGPDPYVVKDGIVEFLSALRKVGTPCAIISHLERRQMDLLLQVSGLDHFFQSDMRVSESDAYESESQQLLGAALRIERRPDHCALFTSTPQSCVAAHEMQMKSVALVGPYPRYDLTTSDSTLLHLDTMNTMNLRALFSDEKSSEPMEQLQVEGPQVKKKSMVKTRFWEDGDR